MSPEANRTDTTKNKPSVKALDAEPFALRAPKQLKVYSRNMLLARKNVDIDNFELLLKNLVFKVSKIENPQENQGSSYSVQMIALHGGGVSTLQKYVTAECLFTLLNILTNKTTDPVCNSKTLQDLLVPKKMLSQFLHSSDFANIGTLFQITLVNTLSILNTHDTKREFLAKLMEFFLASTTEFYHTYSAVKIEEFCNCFLLAKQKLEKKFFLFGPDWIAYSDGPGYAALRDVFYFHPYCQVEKFEYKNKSGIILEGHKQKWKLIFYAVETRDHHFERIDQIILSQKEAKQNRFGSFAPIRLNNSVSFQLNAKNYYKDLYEQINNAKESVMIQGWWISPELYLLRPIEGNENSRLDILLKKKASEGVQIKIMIYKENKTFLPNNSKHTEEVLSNLHPNITVIKNRDGDFSHHEKAVIIDFNLLYLGGIDLCLGRYDTCKYPLTDKARELKRQYYPAKDYSNARLMDFKNVNLPFENMQDRNKDPRMPWHDAQLKIVGPSVKDVLFQFVERWNFIVRTKYADNEISMILFPTEVNEEFYETKIEASRGPEDRHLRCQILRSAAGWSSGLPVKECSILNGYLHMVKNSKHNVYVENQFFITSTGESDVSIENEIGKAIVERILRAHKEGKKWAALITIPLQPAFPSEVNKTGGGSLRHIISRQNMSISIGENSIFGKLYKKGINPANYLLFMSMRTWAEIGPQSALVTTQIYVHSKLIFADNCKCIVGSANINDRSMLGDRDSELAVYVESQALTKINFCENLYEIDTTINAWQQKLLQEKCACDLNLVETVEKQFRIYEQRAHKWVHSNSNSRLKVSEQGMEFFYLEFAMRDMFGIECTDRWNSFVTEASSVPLPLDKYRYFYFRFFDQNDKKWKIPIFEGFINYLNDSEALNSQKLDLLKRVQYLHQATIEHRKQGINIFNALNEPASDRSSNLFSPPFAEKIFQKAGICDPYMFSDPTLVFVKGKLCEIAAQNTKIYRNTFRCHPDDNIQTWNDLKKNEERKYPENLEEKHAMHTDLQKTQGFLVLTPTKYMGEEIKRGNFHYHTDLTTSTRVKIAHD
ncbi:hypothetical protein ACO0QE_002011 [Hanseniaspora vineae]